MDHIKVAKEILSGIGGFENIIRISHCSTRLRFRLIDESKVRDDQIKSIPGVYDILKRGLQYQVVLGSEVGNVYHQLKKRDISSENDQERDNLQERERKPGREAKPEKGNKPEIENNTDNDSIIGRNSIQKKDSTQEKKMENHIFVSSPIRGKVKPLSEVNDPAFASEILGKGVAILPEEGEVYAPFDGVVIAVFSTLHAICLQSDQGVEMLIHIGLNTVRLNGQYFTTYVKTGDKVKKGERILEFDLVQIKEIGYDTIIPIIITNSDNYKEVNFTMNQKVSNGDKVIEIISEIQ